MSPTIDLHRHQTSLEDGRGTHPAGRDDSTPLTAQRDEILRLLLAARPALSGRLRESSSGALAIDLPGGRSIEIGRMRRRGTVRWVVVSPRVTGPRDQVRVTDAATIPGVVRAVLQVIDELAAEEPVRASRAGGPFVPPATVTA